MADNLPVPPDNTRTAVAPLSLDRAALDRVLARAAELHAHTIEPGDNLSEAQLIDLGKEVGIGSEFMRQALAEERTRVALPEERGVVGEAFGPTVATASRIVAGTPSQVLGQLDAWMQREEGLRSKRRFADRLTWEARRDFVGSLQSSFNMTGRAYALKPASEVAATAVAVDAQRTLVRLDADLGEARRQSVGWSGALAGTGVVGSAGLLGFAASIPGSSLLVAGIVAGAWTAGAVATAFGVARAQRRKIHRAQLALEQVLDRLERGEMRRPSNPIADLIANITR
jgi:hypothetical protein